MPASSISPRPCSGRDRRRLGAGHGRLRHRGGGPGSGRGPADPRRGLPSGPTATTWSVKPRNRRRRRRSCGRPIAAPGVGSPKDDSCPLSPTVAHAPASIRASSETCTMTRTWTRRSANAPWYPGQRDRALVAPRKSGLDLAKIDRRRRLAGGGREPGGGHRTGGDQRGTASGRGGPEAGDGPGDGGEPPVRADRDRMMQVMVNCCESRQVFPSGSGRTSWNWRRWPPVGRSASPTMARASRRGTGAGLQKIHQAKRAEKTPGTGLGRPICKQIIEHFDGRSGGMRPGRGRPPRFGVTFRARGLQWRGWAP